LPKQKPKVGLALGAGAAKGLAHIGVIQELLKAKVPIDLIAGSSIGGVFGALLACGHDFERLERLAFEMKQKLLFDLTVPRMGIIKGNKIEELLRLLTQNKNFDQLDIPFYVVAVDLIEGEKVVFDSGNVAKALRASVAIPGIFQPVIMDEKVLVDGAVLDRVPISVVKEKGADIVIAVDVKFGGCDHKKNKVTSIIDVIILSLDIIDRETVNKNILGADVLIQPDLSDLNPNNFDQAHQGIVRGKTAARQAIDTIFRIIDQFE